MSTWMTILGPFASGKTTLARALLGLQATDVKYDLGWEKPIPGAQSADGTRWLGGNLKSGMDGFPKSQDALTLLLRHARDRCELMMTDSPRSSASYNVDYARRESGYARLIYVYYELPEEENLRRFVERRAALGKDPVISDSTLATIRKCRANLAGVWRRAQDAKHHNSDARMTCVRVTADMNAAAVHALVEATLVNTPGVHER